MNKLEDENLGAALNDERMDTVRTHKLEFSEEFDIGADIVHWIGRRV